MKKKAKVLFWVSAVLICTVLYSTPQLIQSSIPSVYYITPTQTEYENLVTCSGTIQSQQVKTLLSDSVIVASDIYVSVGDQVSEGDLLLTVDLEKTKQLAYSPLYFLQELAGDAMIGQTESTDWVSALSTYGITVSMLDGGEMSEQELQKLMQDIGLLSHNDAAGIFTSLPANRELYAPVSGIITDIAIRQNVPLSAGKAVVTIADNTSYKVIAQVNESDISMVNLGDSATIRGVGFGGSTYTGFVSQISPTARRSLNGTSTETVVDVEIQIQNPDDQLKAGFTAKVEITGGDGYELLTVPYEAIRQDENNNEYVYIYEDGKIKKSLVTTGKELTNEVQVLAGINEDSIVVFNPADIAKEGTMIHIKGRANAD